VRLAVDEERRGKVLEPRSGRRGRVPDEVRAEVAVANQPQRFARTRRVRALDLPRLHGGFLSGGKTATRGFGLRKAAGGRIEPRRQLVFEELQLPTDGEEVVVVPAIVVTDVLRAHVSTHRLAAAVARHVPGWREREHAPLER
jgi:hypothetical protein